MKKIILVGIIAAAGAVLFFILNQNSRFFLEDKIDSKFKPFQDVSTNDKNYSAIVYLSRENVLEADQDGKFNPQKTLSRAEWVGMLVKLTGIVPEPNLYRNCFPDVGDETAAAAICFAQKQGWLKGFSTGDVSRSYWQLTQPVLAQEAGKNFHPDSPAQKKEALDSLSRLMRWPTDQPVAFAKERKITDGKIEGNLTKSEAAGTIYRSLATVSLKQKVYSPKLDAEVERYKVDNLIDLDEELAKKRREQAAEVTRLRGKRYAELLGEKAAAEIVAEVKKYGPEAEGDAYLRRAREKTYEEMLAEDKTSGKEASLFNILEPLQRSFSASGTSLSTENVVIYKTTPPHYDKKENITDNPVIKSRDGAVIWLYLDENYRVLAKANWSKAKYGLSIRIGTFFQEGRDLGHVILQLGNFERGVVMAGGGSRWRSLERLELMFTEAIADLEVSLGRKIGSLPTLSPSPTSRVNKVPVIERVDNTQLHGSYEEKPHRYLLKARAFDPEGGGLTFIWSVNCGYFSGPVNGSEIEWRYDTPGECVDAVIIVAAKDKEGGRSEKTQDVFAF